MSSPSRTRGSWGAGTAAVFALLVTLSALLFTTAALAAGKEGWGPPGSFVGRYHVDVQSGGELGVKGGQLTLFMQEEFPGSKSPAGILNLRTRGGNNDLVYLTTLHHRGDGRGAEIHGGAFIGPRIGSFRGTATGPGRLCASFSTRGLGTVKACFVRFSRSPTP
jgi:hypothetical protein